MPMYSKFSKRQIFEICTAGIDATYLFFVPVAIGEHMIYFRVSFWRERGCYVAEPGSMEKDTWTPLSIVAPGTMIETMKEALLENYGVPSIAGVTNSDNVSLLNTVFHPTTIKT